MRTRLLAFAAFLLPVPALAAPLNLDAVDALVTKTLADTKVPSASIAIVEHGAIVYAKAYGMQGPNAPAVTGARYPIASISKQITATAILMLADEGKLTLDDPVGKYVPGLTDGDHVTIRQILSHTAGYRDYWPQDYPFADMAKPITPQGILDRWAKAPLDFPAGTQWQYSNTGFVIAGQIIEKVSGEPLMRFLQTRILTPLGMTSAVDLDTGMTKADAVPHMRYALGPVRVEQPPAPGWLFAAGELAMTASDLARWDIAMMQKKLLTPASYAAQQTAITLPGGKDTHYGLGIEVRDVAGHRILEHGGEAVGFLSENIIAPDDDVAVVVLDNADFADAQTTIGQGILAMLLPTATPAPTVADDTPRIRAILGGLAAGKIDRSQFTEHANIYFTATAIGDYKASLAPLGAPTSFKRLGGGLRGGFTEEVFEVRYAKRKLTLVVRAVPGTNGRIEQFTAYPAS